MESISTTDQAPKAMKRWYGLLSDRALAALMLGFAVLAVLDRSQFDQSLRFTLHSMVAIAPFFILAIAFAGFAKASGIDGFIVRAFSGKAWVTIAAASLAGALSPFCSCGVIPLIAAMLASGVPLAPVMAFCISSPIMDPEMFVITASGINLHFAIAKTLAAVGMGLTSGFAVLALQTLGFLKKPLKRSRGEGCCSSDFDPKAKAAVHYRFWRRPGRRSRFMGEIHENGIFLGKWLILAFFLESLMVAYLPAEWIARVVGDKSALAIPLASFVGIPAYMNGYAAVPLISGLMEIGMSAGAAMAFITSGAVSSIPAALAVYALVRKSIFALYIILGLSGSMLAGLIFQISLT